MRNESGGAVLPVLIAAIFVIATFIMLSGMHYQRAANRAIQLENHMVARAVMDTVLGKIINEISSGTITESGSFHYESDKGAACRIAPVSVVTVNQASEWQIQMEIHLLNRRIPVRYIRQVRLNCNGNTCGILELTDEWMAAEKDKASGGRP